VQLCVADLEAPEARAMPGLGCLVATRLSASAQSHFVIANAAVHRSAISWLEGYFRFLAAFGAHYRKHLSPVRGKAVILGSPGCAAQRAAPRLVGVAPGDKQFLLLGAEGEISTTVRTV
jgi:hypothetical protein